MQAFTANCLYTPLDRVDEPLLLVEGGTIVEVASRQKRETPRGAAVTDFGDAVIAPGFIDIHLHGSGGRDVMESGAEALPAIEQFLAQHGTTAYFPTTVTAPVDDTLRALERLADAIEAADAVSAGRGSRAHPLGIHLEGPFISHSRRGVHPSHDLLPPKLATFERFWQAARGRIALITVAPELDGAIEFISEVSRRGVCVCMGHSDANSQATQAAKRAGARHVTHTFNAMRPLDHREPGILGEALTDSDLTADIIADGIHVAPAIVELFLKAKGPERAVLITDAIAATGMPDGRYRLGALEVEVENGKCLADGKLAGSVLTLDRAVRNVMQFAHLDLCQALRLATLNPASVTRLPNQGSLAIGARADFVVLHRAGGVKNTVILGDVVSPATGI